LLTDTAVIYLTGELLDTILIGSGALYILIVDYTEALTNLLTLKVTELSIYLPVLLGTGRLLAAPKPIYSTDKFFIGPVKARP